ncbi:hypothetical protein [Domibacillus indicus]|uniref:hypothetical protein n=1 Tax=Domibacillus indicus TaxID=1437523 RepID=UPI000618322C|nr:hypothetical protein [Domibacillus indicus]
MNFFFMPHKGGYQLPLQSNYGALDFENPGCFFEARNSWVSPGDKKVELTVEGKPLYVQLNEADSEKLYRLLTDKILSDHVVVK